MKLDLARRGRGAARRGPAPAGRDPVRAQRRRLLAAAPSACAATWSRSSRPTSARRPSASSGSATRSSPSPRSTRCAARCCARSTRSSIFPGSHYVTAGQRAGAGHDRHQGRAARAAGRAARPQNKLVEEQRLQQRTLYDLEMLEQMGRCKGIENYSRHLSGRAPGRAAAHADRLLPQGLPADRRRVAPDASRRSASMYKGDRSRKETLVEYGFRLPSAHRQPAAEVRGVARARAPRRSSSRPRPASTSCSAGAGRGGRADHPPHRPARPGDRGAPGRPPRSTTCWARCASGSRPASACWSPR